MSSKEWRVHNPAGGRQVIVTKDLPGERWLETLAQADCRVKIYTSTDILSTDEIRTAIGNHCDGAIG